MGADLNNPKLCAPRKSSCKSWEYPDGPTTSCKNCKDFCSECTKSDDCKKPNTYYYVDKDQSLKRCAKGCKTCSDGVSCDTCNTDYPLSKGLDVNNPNRCAPVGCSPDTYPDAIEVICRICAQGGNCATCSDAKSCLTCKVSTDSIGSDVSQPLFCAPNNC